jgi:uncharacterized membrane protein
MRCPLSKPYSIPCGRPSSLIVIFIFIFIVIVIFIFIFIFIANGFVVSLPPTPVSGGDEMPARERLAKIEDAGTAGVHRRAEKLATCADRRHVDSANDERRDPSKIGKVTTYTYQGPGSTAITSTLIIVIVIIISIHRRRHRHHHHQHHPYMYR